MNDSISLKIAALKPEIITMRRDFHKHPELGFKEFRTQKIVNKYLSDLGLEVSEIAGTGVVALLKGENPGKTLLLRSDMDAIPVQEQHDYEYRSENDHVMHACGHDGHLSMLLGAAKVLSGLRSQLNGSIKFVFQPNEEIAGAYLMIEEGVMKDPKVDASLGMHLWSQTESGKIDIDAGPVMAASHYFKLTIHGQGGHAGFAHQAVDPILVATNIVQSIQAIQTREIDALDPAVIIFTEIHAGNNTTTVVPEKVEMKGSIRFLYKGGEELRERFERIVKHTCEAHRVSYSLTFEVGNNLLSNDEELTELVRGVATRIFNGPDGVSRAIHTMAGEDFSDYTVDAPGVFMFLGIRNTEKGIVYPHHHPLFDIDEDVLPLGIEMFVRTALRYLSSDES